MVRFAKPVSSFSLPVSSLSFPFLQHRNLGFKLRNLFFRNKRASLRLRNPVFKIPRELGFAFVRPRRGFPVFALSFLRPLRLLLLRLCIHLAFLLPAFLFRRQGGENRLVLDLPPAFLPGCRPRDDRALTRSAASQVARPAFRFRAGAVGIDAGRNLRRGGFQSEPRTRRGLHALGYPRRQRRHHHVHPLARRPVHGFASGAGAVLLD
mmetsp:Transcript_4932/g.16452  ORF Transcript_4932/g.16452 Transcript_4932/m.16452 type:complete len:208 (-) Transcript_4932:1288-1911(-)